MSFLQILVLSIVQGATEFLPVSSSGHLLLVPVLSGWADQGLAIDVAAHVGTLVAVLIYFWRDVWRLATGTLKLLTGRLEAGGRLALYLLAATIPALLLGLFVDRYLGSLLRDPLVVAWALIGFGLVLYAADRVGPRALRIEDVTLKSALLIGFAQVLAFIPGTSRSGITITAARLLGFERAEAARFSFLLSIPAIAAAGLWEGRKLLAEGDPALLQAAVLTAGLSALAGLLAIAFLMAWLRRASFAPFVVYRVGLGLVLMGLIYGGVLNLGGA